MKKAVSMAGTVVAAALLLTACGSDSDDKKKPHEDTASRPASSTSAEGGADAKVTGTYLAKSGGQGLILSISDKKSVLITRKHVCSGEFSDTDGKMLMLKCTDGNTERSAGKVTPSADGKTLTVDWDALAENDTFTKTASLPSGLPTSLPSGFPTDLPTDLPSGLPTG